MKLVIAFILIARIAGAAEVLPDRVEAFLKLRVQPVAEVNAVQRDADAILARPDPGTLFSYYVFGLKRNTARLLDADQAKRLSAVIDAQSAAVLRWHDERNTLRCKFTQLMWRFTGASDADAPKLRAELDTWMRLRMAWTEQEHIAQYRLCRAAWDVLTAEQRQRLLGGEWKEFAKQDTGHAYADFTTAVMTRALGKPNDAEAFEKAVAAWPKERAPLHAAFIKADKRERLIVFAMDINSGAMAHGANVAANAAFAKLYMAETEAFRRIVQAAYVNPQARCAKASGVAWAEAPRRFSGGAAELIELLAPKRETNDVTKPAADKPKPNESK